jgi:hypothetical protein
MLTIFAVTEKGENDMARYIDRDQAIKNAVGALKGVSHITAVDVATALEETPTTDVVPKSEVAREIVAKFKTKMHSEIARNELLAEYGDDFYEGRVDAFHTAIEHLTEIAMAYWCDAQNEATDV